MNIKTVDIACFMEGTFVEPFCRMVDAVAYNNLGNFLMIQRWYKTPTDAAIGMQASDSGKKWLGGEEFQESAHLEDGCLSNSCTPYAAA